MAAGHHYFDGAGKAMLPRRSVDAGAALVSALAHPWTVPGAAPPLPSEISPAWLSSGWQGRAPATRFCPLSALSFRWGIDDESRAYASQGKRRKCRQ